VDSAQANQAVDGYLAFVVAEEQRILRERHTDFLRSKGRAIVGARPAKGRHRETRCHCQRAWLDNRIHMECVGCGGIICFVCGRVPLLRFRGELAENWRCPDSVK
jgi:hypothetical protein